MNDADRLGKSTGVTKMKNDSSNNTTSQIITLAIVVVLVGVVAFVVTRGLLIVQPTEIAVIANSLTGQLEQPRRAGTSVLFPPGLLTPSIYPLTQQEYTMSARSDEGRTTADDSVATTTRDAQPLNLDVTIFYTLDPNRVNDFHLRFASLEGAEGFIRSTVRTEVRNIVSTLDAEQIYGEERATMITRVNDAVRARLDTVYLVLGQVDVRGLRFSEAFSQAIENRLAAEQLTIQRREEANQARERANGERDAAIARAEGEAQAIVLRANAEAEALRVVSEQIAANPALIQYLYVQNLSDNVSLMMVPSDGPFLFDMNSLPGANPNFTAPAVPQSTPTP
jgi:regulator of protease activity HflC (stomatin/prohibitin superfamily)